MGLFAEFIKLCRAGDLDACKAIYTANPGINISACDERAFRAACRCGHLDIIKWLLMVKPNINITACDDAGIYYNLHPAIDKLLMHYISYYAFYKQMPDWFYRKADRIYWAYGLWDLV